MKKHLLISVFLLLGINTQAKAIGFLIEPYLGTHLMGSGDIGNTEVEYSGIAYGARLGPTFLNLSFGLDYSTGTGTTSYETATGSAEDETKRTDVGLFVGYELPVMFRLWATYYMSATLEDDDTAGVYSPGDEFEGSGFGLGVGYTGLPFVSLNLEYKSFSYDEYSDAATGLGLTLTQELSVNNLLLSISAPINF